jgi:hypothetical protein
MMRGRFCQVVADVDAQCGCEMVESGYRVATKVRAST